jgi:hypothetical protein
MNETAVEGNQQPLCQDGRLVQLDSRRLIIAAAGTLSYGMSGFEICASAAPLIESRTATWIIVRVNFIGCLVFPALLKLLQRNTVMVADAAESIVLVWIKSGQNPESPGICMDHTEHFSDLSHALIASSDPARYPAEKLPWIKTGEKWITPEQIRQSPR